MGGIECGLLVGFIRQDMSHIALNTNIDIDINIKVKMMVEIAIKNTKIFVNVVRFSDLNNGDRFIAVTGDTAVLEVSDKTVLFEKISSGKAKVVRSPYSARTKYDMASYTKVINLNSLRRIFPKELIEDCFGDYTYEAEKAANKKRTKLVKYNGEKRRVRLYDFKDIPNNTAFIFASNHIPVLYEPQNVRIKINNETHTSYQKTSTSIGTRVIKWPTKVVLVSDIEKAFSINKEKKHTLEYRIDFINTTEKTKMSKTKQVVNDNVEAAKNAAVISAGKALNAAIAEKVKGQLPLMARGYAETPIGAIVIANLVNFAVQNFAAHNDKARWVADAMLQAAMVDFVSSFNIESMLKEVLDTAKVVPEVE